MTSMLNDCEKFSMNSMLNDRDRTAIAQLRHLSTVEMAANTAYDTDYNMLRWLQAYNYNLNEAYFHLRRHLKFRQFYDLDNIIARVDDHPIISEYFPLGLVGPTGKNNSLLVIESAGRIDLDGLLKSVQLTPFLIQRYKFQERMLKLINDREQCYGTQSSVVYILDLDGLKLDSSLINIVTGPYRILWGLVYTNYPEWISTMHIVNAPNFMSILWKAITPFIPDRTTKKIHIFTKKSSSSTIDDSWQSMLGTIADPSCVPHQFGGSLIDCSIGRNYSGGGVVRIPKSCYWRPDEDSPPIDKLDVLVIAAGMSASINYRVKQQLNDAMPIYLCLNRQADRTYSMAIYISNCNDDATNVDQMDDWCPIFDYPPIPTVDILKVRLPSDVQYITIRFGNESAWFRSLSLHYRIRFVDQDNVDCDACELIQPLSVNK